MPKFALHATRRVAADSSDHLAPWGTARDNNRNLLFNKKLTALMGNRRLDIVDFGCAGGGFVKSCIDGGHRAVGLEGSDHSQRAGRAEWATIPDSLFTCDITGEFRLVNQDTFAGTESDAQFDVITAWEFIEHIEKRDLQQVCRNARQHLKPGGVWIMSVSPNQELINGVALHKTVEDRSWWLQFFQSEGFINHAELVNYFGDDWVRGPYQNAPGTFHLVLTPAGAAPPAVPAAAAYGMNDVYQTVQEFVQMGQLLYPVRLMQLADATHPDDADILATLGVLYACTAQIEIGQAQFHAKRALKIAPTHARATHLLAYTSSAVDLLRRATTREN
jgi:SAM-dependent methyltransferase